MQTSTNTTGGRLESVDSPKCKIVDVIPPSDIRTWIPLAIGPLHHDINDLIHIKVMDHSDNKCPYKHQQADLAKIPIPKCGDVFSKYHSKYWNIPDPCYKILEKRKVLIQ